MSYPYWDVHKRTELERLAAHRVGFLLSAGALMLMPAASSVSGGVAAATLTLGTLGLSRGGFSVNHMDIAPKYAGMVMGISNTAGRCLGRGLQAVIWTHLLIRC